MKQAKCTNCGASIEVDETHEAGICPYCKSAYITEKAIQNLNSTTNNNTAQVINYYYNSAPTIENTRPKRQQVFVPPRPKINAGTCLLLFCLGFWPGLIYAIVVSVQQNQWDEKYGEKEVEKWPFDK